MTNTLSCETPECLDLATIKLIHSHSGETAKATCLCTTHLLEGLYKIGLYATEIIAATDKHIQLIILPLK